MIGKLVGSYLVERELGSGGMGTVYLAEVASDGIGLEPGTQVALKVIHPHLLATRGPSSASSGRRSSDGRCSTRTSSGPSTWTRRSSTTAR